MQNLVDITIWKVLLEFLELRLWALRTARLLIAAWAITGHGQLEIANMCGHQNSFTFSKMAGLSVHPWPFFPPWKCMAKRTISQPPFFPHNRCMAGVINPGDSLQPEISQNQTCLALIWRMGILTFHQENSTDLFSTTSNEGRGKITVYNRSSSLFKNCWFTQIIDYTWFN